MRLERSVLRSEETVSDKLVVDLLPVLEKTIEDMFLSCESVESSIALWAALSTTVDKYATASVKARGEDPDACRKILDRYFLQNPL